jgi:hypothetical protein
MIQVSPVRACAKPDAAFENKGLGPFDSDQQSRQNIGGRFIRLFGGVSKIETMEARCFL